MASGAEIITSSVSHVLHCMRCSRGQEGVSDRRTRILNYLWKGSSMATSAKSSENVFMVICIRGVLQIARIITTPCRVGLIEQKMAPFNQSYFLELILTCI